jgi:menaquinone-9 beta-reductase
MTSAPPSSTGVPPMGSESGTGVPPVIPTSQGRPAPAASSSSSSMPPSRPVEIIGGGLAGLALGLALRRAAIPVTLHEAGDYPRHRVCGEFIAGLDPATIAKLGLEPFLADALRHTEIAWFQRDALRRRQTLPAPALALGRHVLDQRLAAAFVAAGGDLRTRSRVDLKAAPPGRVFAQGRRAAAGSPWLGLKCHAHGLALSAPLELHLGAHAYVGLCELADGRVNVSGLFRQRPGLALDRATALPTYLRAVGLDTLAARLAAADIDSDSHCAVAGLAFGRTPQAATLSATPRRLVLGDALALIPPFTGNGMAMAFQSAALSLDPLLAWSHGKAEWPATVAKIARLVRARFRVRLAAAALLHPALLRPHGQRALTSAAQRGLLPLNPLYHVLH